MNPSSSASLGMLVPFSGQNEEEREVAAVLHGMNHSPSDVRGEDSESVTIRDLLHPDVQGQPERQERYTKKKKTTRHCNKKQKRVDGSLGEKHHVVREDTMIMLVENVMENCRNAIKVIDLEGTIWRLEMKVKDLESELQELQKAFDEKVVKL